MKSYSEHIKTTNPKNLKLRKPVYRSSTIFPFIINKEVDTKIFFFGYWLLKKQIKEVELQITFRNESGKSLKKISKKINKSISYSLSLKKILKNYKKLKIGSVELEILSKQDLIFPYPAMVLNLDSKENSAMVHSFSRTFNNYRDKVENTKFLVPESGFDILPNKNLKPFISFTNGDREEKNKEILIEIINFNGEKLLKKIKIKKLNLYETKLLYFLNDNEKKFLGNKKGTAKINHNFKNFFSRFLVGNTTKELNNFSITHSYYDLSNKQDVTQYWNNPDQQKFYDSSFSVPYFKNKSYYTELAIYPIFSKVTFELSYEIYNEKGIKISNRKKIFQLKNKLEKPVYLNLKDLIKNTNISNKNSNYYFKFLIKSEKIVSRLKFGLNVGLIKSKSSLPCNICFNAKLPSLAILKKPSAFKWGLIRNKYNSIIIFSNFSLEKKSFKEANLKIKFWNEFKEKCLEKKLTINNNGSFWFILNKYPNIKKFLGNKSGWVTIESDNPNIHGWYFEMNKNGSVGADHLF